jgi:hypothetical protein
MLPDFKDIIYLNNGSPQQQKAYAVLTESKILYHLQPFHPTLAGTMPLDIFIEGKSDLDILCEAASFESVENVLLKCFVNETGFSIYRKDIQGIDTLLCNFMLQSFPVEIFCQAIAPTHQLAYRHMVIEYRLLKKYGEPFKKEVLKLKKQGIKTEPAFAILLRLSGNPYEALLALEQRISS